MSLLNNARAALVAFACAFSGAAVAQEFPQRPITIIVPFASGGAGDILARMVGQRLEKAWGQPIVVESRPGAGGVIGAVAASRATADGHTLIIAPSPTMAVNVTLYKKLPYDPAADFTPLAMAAATPFVLVVNPSVPAKTVAEFLKYAKERPAPLNYATAGPGVPHHLFMELLQSMTGIKMTPVPYKGSMPGLNDVISGHVPAMFVDLGPALGQVRAGRVRALGVSMGRRVEAIADVPPINDTVKGFDVASWQMFAAPSGTPRPVIDKLHRELKSILAMPDVREQILKAGMLPLETGSVEDLRAFVRSEIKRWGDVVRQAGIAGAL